MRGKSIVITRNLNTDVVENKSKIRDKLNRDIEKFLAGGGKIKTQPGYDEKGNKNVI